MERIVPAADPSASSESAISRPKERTVFETLINLYLACRQGVVKRPFLSLLRLRLGFDATVEFPPSGQIPLKGGDLHVFLGLACLSYPHGVVFRLEPRRPTDWGLDPATRILTTPEGIHLSFDSLQEPGILAETFSANLHYHGTDLAGQTVVDVGSNFGDTALYFARRGARVYAYEPDPKNFQLLIANLRLNPDLSDLIQARAEAVGLDGSLPFHSGLGGKSGFYEADGQVVSVPSVSLAKLLSRHNLTDPFLLKLDAKGAEFEILEQKEVGKFHQVEVEYTTWGRPNRSADEIVELLERAGFRISRRFKHEESFFRLDTHGMIHAER